MTKEERAAFAREAERRVRECVLSRRGQALPSAREIQRETGIASLATVHRYLHRLAEAGEIALPEESYPSASRRGGQLGIRHKRLFLSGGAELELSLILVRGRDGRADAEIVRCASGGTERSILACRDFELRAAERRPEP